ncbi:MarR family transcriptional regulator [Streptomyces yokosukanensis]|uniref:MarR family transcriptional regulator n=1 Tax=Streptomyces yokosukanensis TaxID=67386 RepID=A0A101P723_9ACTN|nr:MarR family transcriptional regulator [Streptomyces yokosukanensis]KUN06136.1 MarR family transcriptional regulator [Streptomyces yokosukanensis]
MTAEQRKIRPMNTAEEALVRSIDRIVHVLPRALDAAMQQEQQISLTEYHVVTRLQARDLVERVRGTDDRRGRHAVLTDRGLARLREGWPSNLDGGRRHLLDHLEGSDLHALAQAFAAIGEPADSR